MAKAHGVASVDGEVACETDISAILAPQEPFDEPAPRPRLRYPWQPRRVAGRPCSVELEAAAPDRIFILGDLVQNGPRPAEVMEAVMALEACWRLRHRGQHRYRRRRRRLRGGLPLARRGPDTHRAASEWAREQLRDDQLEYLRRLPAERRLALGMSWCWPPMPRPVARPAGLPADLDAAVTVQRATRTDARVICCGHTHVADVRELGRKLLVNPGSIGYAFDGTPDACWGMVTLEEGETPEPSSSAPATTPAPPPRRSPRAALPVTSIVLPPFARGGSCDDLRGRGAPCGGDRPRRGHAAGSRCADLLASPCRG